MTKNSGLLARAIEEVANSALVSLPTRFVGERPARQILDHLP